MDIYPLSFSVNCESDFEFNSIHSSELEVFWKWLTHLIDHQYSSNHQIIYFFLLYSLTYAILEALITLDLLETLIYVASITLASYIFPLFSLFLQYYQNIAPSIQFLIMENSYKSILSTLLTLSLDFLTVLYFELTSGEWLRSLTHDLSN